MYSITGISPSCTGHLLQLRQVSNVRCTADSHRRLPPASSTSRHQSIGTMNPSMMTASQMETYCNGLVRFATVAVSDAERGCAFLEAMAQPASSGDPNAPALSPVAARREFRSMIHSQDLPVELVSCLEHLVADIVLLATAQQPQGEEDGDPKTQWDELSLRSIALRAVAKRLAQLRLDNRSFPSALPSSVASVRRIMFLVGLQQQLEQRLLRARL